MSAARLVNPASPIDSQVPTRLTKPAADGPDANISDFGDGIWWAVTTMTTVVTAITTRSLLKDAWWPSA